jgi:hypothetical protein
MTLILAPMAKAAPVSTGAVTLGNDDPIALVGGVGQPLVARASSYRLLPASPLR